MYLIYTDGACSGNNSKYKCPGGYGYVVVKDCVIVYEGGGHDPDTTNNRMEMTAVIESLKSLNNYINDKNDSNDTTAKSSCLIITDSRYVCDNWNDYFETWKSTGWRKSNGKPVLNVDLWKAIEKEISNFQSVEFQWVKGHDVNQYNQKADLIACGNITALRRLTCSK